MAAFSDEDKARIRYHLEYPNVEQNTTAIAGAVFHSDAFFKLESMMQSVSTAAVPLIQRTLDIMDSIELQMVDALQRLQAAKADVVTLNPHEHLALQENYIYWQNRLCKQLAVVVNPNAPGSRANGLNFKRG